MKTVFYENKDIQQNRTIDPFITHKHKYKNSQQNFSKCNPTIHNKNTTS